MRRLKFRISSPLVYTVLASLFRVLIHLISSSFFLFIRVVFSSTRFHFLEIILSSFCFLTFSNVVMYLLFANLQLLRKLIETLYSWTLILIELMWPCTICWDIKDFSCKFSTNKCLLMLNPLSITLWLWEKRLSFKKEFKNLV